MDYWAYVNNYNKIHPLEKSVLALTTMILVLIWDKPIYNGFVILCMSIAIVVGAGIPFKIYMKYLSLPLIFIVVTLVSVVFEIHSNQSGFIYSFQAFHGFIGVTQESLNLAIRLFFRTMATLSCLYFLAMTTPLQDIVYLLEKLHCPRIVTELMVLTYRFIFIFLVTARTIYAAQSARLGYQGFFRSIKSLSTLSAGLFIKAYMHSKILYQAMVSRGYMGTFHTVANDNAIDVKRLFAIVILEVGLFTIGKLSP